MSIPNDTKTTLINLHATAYTWTDTSLFCIFVGKQFVCGKKSTECIFLYTTETYGNLTEGKIMEGWYKLLGSNEPPVNEAY